jgi:Ni,Fe-hydrogenase III large subunit
MKLERQEVEIERLTNQAKIWLETKPGSRVGVVTSLDGGQLVTLILDPLKGLAEYWESPLSKDSYKSLTLTIPQVHWHERVLWDMFGILPEGHPRLKHVILHDVYPADFFPLRTVPVKDPDKPVMKDRNFNFLQVKGEGVYEIPVGPIHAGVIEPGHFRFSCFGETILNLELKFGYVHRGVEKRLAEVPWKKARFVAEAAASDTACANALAHAVALESILGVEVSPFANRMRTLAFEIERLAMHIIDLAGMGTDTGYLVFAQNMSRLRGVALGCAQALSGSRFLRAFIKPGGVKQVPEGALAKILDTVKKLRQDLKAPIALLQESQAITERMEVASISHSLAHEFGMSGVTGRSAGIDYDVRQHFKAGTFPEFAPPPAVEVGGHILARSRVRAREIMSSIDTIEAVLQDVPQGAAEIDLPEALPANSIGCGIVEAFRGELIHLVVTDENGKIRRYCIKDPSRTNWTAVSIAIRNNLIADFPLCNKSLALSYSGNDL